MVAPLAYMRTFWAKPETTLAAPVTWEMAYRIGRSTLTVYGPLPVTLSTWYWSPTLFELSPISIHVPTGPGDVVSVRVSAPIGMSAVSPRLGPLKVAPLHPNV